MKAWRGSAASRSHSKPHTLRTALCRGHRAGSGSQASQQAPCGIPEALRAGRGCSGLGQAAKSKVDPMQLVPLSSTDPPALGPEASP